MKNMNILFRFTVWIIAITGIQACSDGQDYPEVSEFSGDGIPLSLCMERTTAKVSDLQFGLYVFSRSAGHSDDYRLDSIIEPLTASSRLKLGNAALVRKEYRFLFIATPGDHTSLKVVNTDRSAPEQGTAWEDIRIISQGDRISVDNYYQVTDRSAEEILAADTLYGHLNRMVGQMVFRFVKIGDSMSDLQSVDLKKVTSVFDRIRNIRIDYENYPSAVAFDQQGLLRAVSDSSTESLVVTQNITTVLLDYRLNLPQPGLIPVQGDASAGGEIVGYCFLPAVGRIRATLTFTYYDTTPICGKTNHLHDENCYPLKTLVLHIPKSAVPGLSVEADAYTVNQAGIHTDRVIDIEYGANMEIETGWN